MAFLIIARPEKMASLPSLWITGTKKAWPLGF
jgi:hypothetical protein